MILKISGINYNLLSVGNNLIDPLKKNNKIPFKEKQYGGKELLNELIKKYLWNNN